jgi:hypothetical protein
MGDFLSQFYGLLTRRGLLIGALVFAVTFVVNVSIVSFILVKLPKDYFRGDREAKFLSGRHPALYAAGIIGKNVLGVLLVILGIVLSIPGVPGQGLLTILMGIILLDFPGKRRLEQKLLSRPGVLKTINRLRARFRKSPLEVDAAQ